MTTAARVRREDIAHGERPHVVYQQLRDLIVHGRLAPGSRLIESDVAARLGVSRTPVRGALQRLQQERLIVDVSGRRLARPTVAPLTNDDAHELYYIVGEVEGLAARWAAEQGRDRRRALARSLRATNARLRRAAQAKRPDYNAVFELDEAFHRAYVEAGAKPRLLSLHDVVKPQAERYSRLYVHDLLSEIGTSVREHEAIARAIASGDPDAAQRAVQTNWRNAADRLAKVIDRAGERGEW